MKKILALLLAVLMVFSMVACANNASGDQTDSSGDTADDSSAPSEAAESSTMPAPTSMRTWKLPVASRSALLICPRPTPCPLPSTRFSTFFLMRRPPP